MGYTTDFFGVWTVTPPLIPEHVAYLTAFSRTRRMARDPSQCYLADPLREAVGLSFGADGGFIVCGEGLAGQDKDSSIINYNEPPAGQPGLWCQWEPSPDGKTIGWDGGEKFYNYIEWIEYLIAHFLRPWGYALNGDVEWQGEEPGDRGIIRILGNEIKVGSAEITWTWE